MAETRAKDKATYRSIADPVHGMIQVDGLINFLIDQPEFQRLRDIQQLGLCSFVYPTATHNRFQHSIGTYHMARQWLDALKKHQPQLPIEEKDEICVCVAALFHDLGHGPFSHFWDGTFVKWVAKKGMAKAVDHETMGIKIFEKMLKNASFKNDLVDYYRLDDDGCDIVKDLILGKGDLLPPNKKFLAMIVSNKGQEIDVDKWDYLLRDSFHTRDAVINLSVERFHECLSFAENDDGKWCTAVREKDLLNVVMMFQYRHCMHRQVYQHKTVSAIGEMLYEAFKLVGPILDLFRDFSQDENINDFLKLTDSIFWKIANGDFPSNTFPEDPKKTKKYEEDLAKAKEGQEIVKRILRRDLYKLLATASLTISGDVKIDLEKIQKDLNEDNKVNEDTGEKEETVCLTTAYFDLAGKSENPLQHLIILNKDNESISEEKISPMLKVKAEPETEIRLFCKDSSMSDERKGVICDRFENAFSEFNGVRIHCKWPKK